MLIKKNRVREYLGERSVSGEVFSELDSEVKRLLDRSVERALANERRTIMARDI